MLLPELKSFEDFLEGWAAHCKYEAAQSYLVPLIQKDRVRDAYVQWYKDMERIQKFELDGHGKPDEFKQAGHIAYWLRRCQTIIDWKIANEDRSEKQRGSDDVDFIYRYGNEYMAFSYGFKLCLVRNCEVLPDGSRNVGMTGINMDFNRTISHFLKNKSVSPHAMFLIYKSLFLHPV